MDCSINTLLKTCSYKMDNIFDLDDLTFYLADQKESYIDSNSIYLNCIIAIHKKKTVEVYIRKIDIPSYTKYTQNGNVYKFETVYIEESKEFNHYSLMSNNLYCLEIDLIVLNPFYDKEIIKKYTYKFISIVYIKDFCDSYTHKKDSTMEGVIVALLFHDGDSKIVRIQVHLLQFLVN